MRKLLLLAAMTVLFPAAASAQTSLGVKLGLSFPWGEVMDTVDVKDVVSMAVPIEVNGMFTVAPNMAIGAYASYGAMPLSSDSKDYCDYYGLDCSAHQWRLGVKGEYKLGQEGQGFVPYLGANLGMEWLVAKESGVDIYGAYDLKDSYRGWEFGLEAGGDMPVSPQLSLGLFANLSFAKYNHLREELDSAGLSYDDSASIPSSITAMHGFFQIGVRGTFGLGGAQ